MAGMSWRKQKEGGGNGIPFRLQTNLTKDKIVKLLSADLNILGGIDIL